MDDQNPLAILAADAEAGFEDRWKYQDTGSLAPELLGARILLDESVQRCIGVGIDLLRRGRPCGARRCDEC
jgi:hypothetical protein